MSWEILSSSFLVAVGIWFLFSALLLQLGKVKPGKWWGHSPVFDLLMGVAWTAQGIGSLLVLGGPGKIAAFVVFFVAFFAALRTTWKPWPRKPR